MGLADRLLPAFGYGVAFGTLFYILGGVANSIFAQVTPQMAGVLGFASAIAIDLAKKSEKQ